MDNIEFQDIESQVVTISKAREDFEKWLEDVIKEIQPMFKKETDAISLLSDYEITVQIFDERKDLLDNMLKKKSVVTKKDFEEEAQIIQEEINRPLERCSAICFTFIGDDEELIKKHMNFNIHESSIKKYYNSYIFQKRLSKNVSIYQAALYCYETFMSWLEKKVKLT